MKMTLLFTLVLMFVGCKGSATVQVTNKNSPVTAVTTMPLNSHLYSVIHDEHEYVIFLGIYGGGIIHSPKCGCSLTTTKKE